MADSIKITDDLSGDITIWNAPGGKDFIRALAKEIKRLCPDREVEASVLDWIKFKV